MGSNQQSLDSKSNALPDSRFLIIRIEIKVLRKKSNNIANAVLLRKIVTAIEQRNEFFISFHLFCRTIESAIVVQCVLLY